MPLIYPPSNASFYDRELNTTRDTATMINITLHAWGASEFP